ncbi:MULTISPECIES: hypothetical protein [Mycobacterium avium complex (MAC)]|uniref:Uncharacterized protein n=2 Tax=Mycobacterium avium complex (MAC) TaxID=120793 RepID=A0A2A3L507_MYCAV|nr:MULTISPECIES: hypothetical protein [Mycobacterium avium complex (MAC)]AXO25359.1 hypothetical protein DFS55_24370 [Mycobacterium avium subsp. hominissuis]MBG0729410.1 hypothetical protein [Mycobacterium avium]MBZ4500002.1 hypothetical protein [Mycobacterium avium subsp. hominissuis]MBZ4522405.1 hypothetical protein [Mycobacterium avium subsp. hominissuis]MBZ4528289.1 hypothetical protein [Mycobacterium avium subsp. hominissuis]
MFLGEGGMFLTRLRRAGSGLAGAALAAAVVLSGHAHADPGRPPPPLPVFTPAPSDWSPNFDIWPYNTFTSRVTPEMISGMSDSCQWFKSQFDPLMRQINDLNAYLGDQHDDYAAAAVQRNADAVVGNIDRSTAFLTPRVKPLIITNQPDNFGPYSPVYGGESMTHLAFQLSRISDSIKRKDPSGVTHANIVSATGWANALRDSGACN